MLSFRYGVVCVLLALLWLVGGTAPGQAADPPEEATAIWVSIDEVDNVCDGNVLLGTGAEIFFRVEARTTSVTIYNYDAEGKRIRFDARDGVPQRVAGGDEVLALRGTFNTLGRETFVLQAESTSRAFSAVCTLIVVDEVPEFFSFEVDDPYPDQPVGDITIAQMGIGTLNRGCNTDYWLGQQVRILFQADDPDSTHPILVTLENHNREGSISQLYRGMTTQGETRSIFGTLTGRRGSGTLVLRVRLNSGSFANSYCQLTVR